ncbi:unnamed protein product [Leuciscus chuanchicus]
MLNPVREVFQETKATKSANEDAMVDRVESLGQHNSPASLGVIMKDFDREGPSSHISAQARKITAFLNFNSTQHGLLIFKASESWRKERILDVPLCVEDCNGWFDDCKNDYTCKDNWHKGWDWSTGTNRCPEGSQCRLWTEIFSSAQDMCEKIWSNSYKFTTLRRDSGRCMQMWFEGTNPNKKVAEYYLTGDAETVAMATGLRVCVFALLVMMLR